MTLDVIAVDRKAVMPIPQPPKPEPEPTPPPEPLPKPTPEPPPTDPIPPPIRAHRRQQELVIAGRETALSGLVRCSLRWAVDAGTEGSHG
jgi:hypothetical protein